MPTLILKRVDQTDGMLRKWKVYCDKELIGRISHVEERTFEIEKGKHNIKVSMFPHSSKEYEVDLKEDNSSIELYTGFIYSNIIESLFPGSIKILPKDEFFMLYNREPELQFKNRIKHNSLIAFSGLLASAFILYLLFHDNSNFDNRGLCFLLALGIAIGAVQFIKKDWIMSKSFFLNKPLYDAAAILFIFLLYTDTLTFQIIGIFMALVFLMEWIFLRKTYGI